MGRLVYYALWIPMLLAGAVMIGLWLLGNTAKIGHEIAKGLHNEIKEL